ncbi:Smr/MutS family protein [Methyloglobulus sp.]|uniref:Smr/MutS family protein n=1 Tax=Methyloglobulus sp. TaxID=2518622 RepID=UPI0017D5B8B8|nr:DNA mismatch repair protein MutS [Methyloglobulus sp.]
MTKKIISPKDSDLFRQSVGEVRIVKTDKVQLRQDSPKPYPKPQSHDFNDVWQHDINSEIDNVSHEETLRFTAPGIQNSVLAKLRKGFFGVQAEMDLHGLNGEAAKQQLLEFLHESVSAGYRCVHIIHGKGYRSSDNHPVLKNHINRWLRQHKDVQAFCSASQKQGGAGAVYVLLKIERIL